MPALDGLRGLAVAAVAAVPRRAPDRRLPRGRPVLRALGLPDHVAAARGDGSNRAHRPVRVLGPAGPPPVARARRRADRGRGLRVVVRRAGRARADPRATRWPRSSTSPTGARCSRTWTTGSSSPRRRRSSTRGASRSRSSSTWCGRSSCPECSGGRRGVVAGATPRPGDRTQRADRLGGARRCLRDLDDRRLRGREHDARSTTAATPGPPSILVGAALAALLALRGPARATDHPLRRGGRRAWWRRSSSRSRGRTSPAQSDRLYRGGLVRVRGRRGRGHRGRRRTRIGARSPVC